MSDAILGLDIGTTSTKALLFDLSGAELAAAERAYPLLTPQPGWVEQDPEELWRALLHVLRAVGNHVRAERLPRTRPLALALAAQSGSLLPARQDGTPLANIITWLDGRTEALVQRWQADGIEPGVRALSGWHLYPGLPLPTIAWIRQHNPDLFAATERWLSVNGFLVHRLTGRFCTNPSNGGGMQLLDLASTRWSEDLCALAGVVPEQLSPVLPSSAIVGPISPEVGRLTGLPSGTLVVNGGHDQGCTALGLGVTAPGQVLLGCGTSWVVTAVVEAPEVAAMPEGLNMHYHPAPGRWTASMSLGGLGASLEWLLKRWWSEQGSGPDFEHAWAALDAEIAVTTPGGHGLHFVPLCGGHRAPAGDQSGALWGLRLDHTRADVARAVMEGAACELRWALESLWSAGMPIEQMIMIGGATRSPIWPGIVADVTGLPLLLPQAANWPAVGAAILAGLGAGAFKSVADGVARFQRPARRVDPEGATVALYEQHYAAYRQLSATVLAGQASCRG
jgi:xylulokinase